MSIESVMSSNHLILCCPLFLLPHFFPGISANMPQFECFARQVIPNVQLSIYKVVCVTYDMQENLYRYNHHKEVSINITRKFVSEALKVFCYL